MTKPVLAVLSLLLLVMGCRVVEPQTPAASTLSPEALDAQRIVLFKAQLVRKGWTVTNWNDEEIWVAPKVAFHPRTPPVPMAAFRNETDEVVTLFASLNATSPPPYRVINYTNEYQNVVVLDDRHRPILNEGWTQDTNIYSPNFIWVFEPRDGTPPGTAKFITTQP